MAKKIQEEKVAELLAEAVDNNWFNPSLCADLIVNHLPLYTQDRLVILMSEVIRQQAIRFETEWENGYTSDGLMLSSHLAEVISAHERGLEI
jgi:hypothetical protein